jgi:hypothetical protein
MTTKAQKTEKITLTQELQEKDLLSLVDQMSVLSNDRFSKNEAWLYFNNITNAIKTVQKLQASKYRMIRFFESPKGSNQLNYTIQVQRLNKFSETQHSQTLLKLLKDFGVNPIEVSDLRACTFLAVFDNQKHAVKAIKLMLEAGLKAEIQKTLTNLTTTYLLINMAKK